MCTAVMGVIDSLVKDLFICLVSILRRQIVSVSQLTNLRPMVRSFYRRPPPPHLFSSVLRFTGF